MNHIIKQININNNPKHSVLNRKQLVLFSGQVKIIPLFAFTTRT